MPRNNPTPLLGISLNVRFVIYQFSPLRIKGTVNFETHYAIKGTRSYSLAGIVAPGIKFNNWG